jgi:hypothetical protein
MAKLVYVKVGDARDALPAAERASYLKAQQSIVDARRSAERHEGRLRID